MTNLLNMLVRQKRYREVVNVADTIQKLDADAEWLERKGWALFPPRRLRGSTAAYRESIAIDHALACVQRARRECVEPLAAEQGVGLQAWDDAQSAFRASLRINPDQQKVINLLRLRDAEVGHRPAGQIRYPAPMPDTSLLEVFPTPNPTPFLIEHLNEEFTSVCPVTGHPDFGD